MPRPIAHTIPEAARESRVGRTLIYDAIKARELAVVKLGRRTLILDDDLRKWLQRHRVPTTAEAA